MKVQYNDKIYDLDDPVNRKVAEGKPVRHGKFVSMVINDICGNTVKFGARTDELVVKGMIVEGIIKVVDKPAKADH